MYLLLSMRLPLKKKIDFNGPPLLSWAIHSSSDVAEIFSRFKHTNTCLHTFLHILLSSSNTLWLAINCGGEVGGFDLWPYFFQLLLHETTSFSPFSARIFLFPSILLKKLWMQTLSATHKPGNGRERQWKKNKRNETFWSHGSPQRSDFFPADCLPYVKVVFASAPVLWFTFRWPLPI